MIGKTKLVESSTIEVKNRGIKPLFSACNHIPKYQLKENVHVIR